MARSITSRLNTPSSLMSVDGVNPEVLADFAAIRKAKRKGPVTTAVIEAVCQQAHLAGLTLEQALQTCCDPRRRWAHAAIESTSPASPCAAPCCSTPAPRSG